MQVRGFFENTLFLNKTNIKPAAVGELASPLLLKYIRFQKSYISEIPTAAGENCRSTAIIKFN